MMLLRRGATVLATGAAAVLLSTSVAGAAPVSTNFSSTIGVPNPASISADPGSLTPFVDAVLTVVTDTTRPGESHFPGFGDILVDLTVHWENHTTGAKGDTPGRNAFGWVPTGSGDLTATATIDGPYITLVPGRASWKVP